MGFLDVFLLVAAVAGQSAELPPPFPRPGTTLLLENDAVAVWNVSWLKQQYPLHTHRYDLVGVSYAEGDRIITQGNAPGRLVTTKAWVFQTNRANVTHVEEGASDPPMRAVLIEVKTAGSQTAGRAAARWLTPGGRRAGVGEQPRRRLGGDAGIGSSCAPSRWRCRRVDRSMARRRRKRPSWRPERLTRAQRRARAGEHTSSRSSEGRYEDRASGAVPSSPPARRQEPPPPVRLPRLDKPWTAPGRRPVRPRSASPR